MTFYPTAIEGVSRFASIPLRASFFDTSPPFHSRDSELKLLPEYAATGYNGAVDYYQKAAPVMMNISHGGVCICMLGVLLSCDPERGL